MAEYEKNEYAILWRKNTEIIIGITECIFSFALMLLYVSAVKPVDSSTGFAVTGLALFAFPLLCILRLIYVYKVKLGQFFPWFSAGLDILFLSVVIYTFSKQYGLAAASIKAPTFIFYFVLIALHAMRLNPWLVVITGAFAATCWLTLFLAVTQSETIITRSYLDFIGSPALLVGAEVEKMFGLLTFAAILGVGVWRAKSVLNDAISKNTAEAQMYKAVEASRAKSEFLANMSHEIRTPMNGLLGIGDLLEQTKLDDQQSEYVRILRNSGDALLGVINDILDISKIESGKLELSQTVLSLNELVADVVETHATAALKKELELISSFKGDLENQVLGDDIRLRQVVSNLIGNAVKFTESGHVLVELTSEVNEDNTHIVSTLVVKDTGIGIAPDHLERIFHKFEQADNSVTRKYGGTGLGLAITKSLIDAMGGTITVKSNKEEGTSFTIKLMQRIAARKSDKQTPPRDIASLKNKRALVIDDLPINLHIIKDMLAGWGMNCVTCVSPEQGVQSALQTPQQFDVILMDYHMPGLDGVTASRLISDKLGDQCPSIFLLTSMDEYANASKLVGSGIAGALIKPIRASKLCNLLMGELQATRKSEPKTDAEDRTSSMKDKSKLRILFAEDNEVNRMVLNHMLGPLNGDITVAVDGQFAIELFKDNGPFDIVLMDISMPRLDGLSATHIIRQLELEHGLGHTPIIGITAHATPEDWSKAIDSGMNDCLTKPVKQEKLLALIRSLTDQHAIEEAANR